MRFLSSHRRPAETLLWSRDIRFVRRLAEGLKTGHTLELESGMCLIAPARVLTEARAAEVARASRAPVYGVAAVDGSIPVGDRYLVALASAVQVSGIADRVGMGGSIQVAQTKMLDLFFRLRHGVMFQPIVDLGSGRVHEYECLFRPEMPTLRTSISAMVAAAINTDRAVELDAFIVRRILERIAEIEGGHRSAGRPGHRYAINFTPTSLVDPSFSGAALSELVAARGLLRRSITIECTEHQAVSDVRPLARQAKTLRRLGFGFAVDDAGAGYASFTLIAALRPSIIKIDRDIVHGIGDKQGDAKQALVEAFVSFGRRIGARLVAEGIETRRELAMLTSLGVPLGQGYLLGRPATEPSEPRSIDGLRAGVLSRARRGERAGRPAAADRGGGRAEHARRAARAVTSPTPSS
jgi:EAL domain-containing protein (putative c-di-GMP-specific phosphodiesterase class I)